jgi:short-subunit dehydrogenase
VLAVRADLRSFDGCEQLAREVRSVGRPVDALLLNAGIGVGGAFLETPLHQELDVIALNCNHVVHVAKLLVPAMVARGQGRVMMTASVVSTSPAPYEAVYGASKAFVMSFAHALREELKDTGVTVTALLPGATDTNFYERANMLETPVGEMPKDDPAVVARRGYDAMMAGKASVLGGELRSRFEGLANELLPETVKARLAARQNRPKAKD